MGQNPTNPVRAVIAPATATTTPSGVPAKPICPKATIASPATPRITRSVVETFFLSNMIFLCYFLPVFAPTSTDKRGEVGQKIHPPKNYF
jgi:hypothetical protein